jgi:hypothetical protein
LDGFHDGFTNFVGYFRYIPTSLPTVDDAAVQRAVEEVAAAVAHQEAEPKMQHIMSHDIGHGEAVSNKMITVVAVV